MNDLQTTTQLVKAILEEDEQSRNSDSRLYLKVLEIIAERHGYNMKRMSVYHFLECRASDYPFFPGFETVRRSRQKIQATYPELAACDKVNGMRMVEETNFRQYARGEV
jgi:hypothetical protein